MFSMCLFICLFFECYSIKPLHSSETKVYFKFDPKAANIAHVHVKHTHIYIYKKKRIHVTISGSSYEACDRACGHLFTNLKFLTLRSLTNVHPATPSPRLLIFQKFSTQDILISHAVY